MLLFQKRFWPGLQDGSITLTFRRWQAPRVKPGGRYRCHPIGVVEVDAIAELPSEKAITDADARRAGFADRAEALAYLDDRAAPATAKSKLYRVTLHHAGDGDRVQGAMDATVSPDEAAQLRERLARLDARSPVGPWTAKTLAIIARRPQVAAARLAEALGREKLDFKADVVKLKRLGLTQSFEVGYELTPKGRAYLEATKRRARSNAFQFARGMREHRPHRGDAESAETAEAIDLDEEKPPSKRPQRPPR